MLKKNEGSFQGNEKYEGFIPDLLARLSQILAFNYTIKPAKDGRYGSINSNGSWTGMIGEVVRGEAMLAAAPISITARRHKHIDYVKPFMHLGLTFVMKKPTVANETVGVASFNIFWPVAPEIWALVAATTLAVALVMWGMNRFNPYEWGGLHNMGRATQAEGNTFSGLGSLWFAFVTLQWQGYDRCPRSLGSRVLSCFWFAFVTLCIVTYTGSLASHMFWASTIHQKTVVSPSVTTFEELVAHGKIDYGCVRFPGGGGGTVYNLLQNVAKGDMYKKMRSFWKASKMDMFVRSYPNGIARARRGNYAFILDSPEAKYATHRSPCNLVMAKEVLHPKAYGMAVSKRYKHLQDLDRAILEMRESGEITDLETMWWEGKGECWNVKTPTENVKPGASSVEPVAPLQVNLKNFWVAFLLILIGLICSLLVGLVEFIFFKLRGQYTESNAPKDVQLSQETSSNIITGT